MSILRDAWNAFKQSSPVERRTEILAAFAVLVVGVGLVITLFVLFGGD